MQTQKNGVHVQDAASNALIVAALGVVFGDIGTSPLYALKECFVGAHGVAVNQPNVLGILSLFTTSLVMVVAVKYIIFMMKADNKGEGGIFALLALIPQKVNGAPRSNGALVLLVLFGAALLYGDGVITPAISVLSALEGLNVATTAAKPYILPLTVLVLLGLFAIQRRGTASVGRVFGLVMMVWFITIALLGIMGIAKNPQVLYALNPMYGINFFLDQKLKGFLVLGAVVLCVTGGEALYADMGHFGSKAIKYAWAMVMPCLLLSYYGQGSLLLSNPMIDEEFSTFFGMVSFLELPSWLLYPLVAEAAMATVIASQALISGAFSLTRQGIQLGYCPRMTIVHTNGEQEGQIYIPQVNWGVAICCILLVLVFRTSSGLASAYGIAVTGTMTITSIVFYFLIREVWGWSKLKACLTVGTFLVFDCSFLVANLVKIMEGGYVPLLMALVVFLVMTTWKTGRMILASHLMESALDQGDFIKEQLENDARRKELGIKLDGLRAAKAVLKEGSAEFQSIESQIEETKKEKGKCVRVVSGTAVFMSPNTGKVPPGLMHNLKCNRVRHSTTVLLSVENESVTVPEVSPDDRCEVHHLGNGIWRVTLRYGFMESPNVPEGLKACKEKGVEIELEEVRYFLGRETLIINGSKMMGSIRKQLFARLSRNAKAASEHFQLPPEKVVELGMQIDL